MMAIRLAGKLTDKVTAALVFVCLAQLLAVTALAGEPSYVTKSLEERLQDLHSDNSIVRANAVRAFGLDEVSDMRVITALIAMEHDQCWLVRFSVIEALSEINLPEEFDIAELASALNDPSPIVRFRAAAALQETSHYKLSPDSLIELLPTIVQLFYDDDLYVRANSINLSLSIINNDPSRYNDFLLSNAERITYMCLNDEVPVRIAAMNYLTLLENNVILINTNLRDTNWYIRESMLISIRNMLQKSDIENVAALLEEINRCSIDANPVVRWEAIQCLLYASNESGMYLAINDQEDAIRARFLSWCLNSLQTDEGLFSIDCFERVAKIGLHDQSYRIVELAQELLDVLSSHEQLSPR